MKFWALFVGVSASLAAWSSGAETPSVVTGFFDQHCFECHDEETKKGNLDLTALAFDLDAADAFAKWVTIHDRVAAGEMPPPKKPRPEAGSRDAFTAALSADLTAVDAARTATEGRATRRRLNRHEYENTLRDLLSLPYLEVKDFLPEDTVSHGFNKIGDALDVSHVQVSRYLAASEFALRRALAPQVAQPEKTTRRFHTWDDGEFFGRIHLEGPRERRTFPIVGHEIQRSYLENGRRRPDQDRDPAQRDQEAMVALVSTYEPTEIRFGEYEAPVAGFYRVRLSAYSVWMSADFSTVTAGRRPEPIVLSSDRKPSLLRKLGGFDVGPEPTVGEMEVWLEAGETIRPDAARLHRSRPPDHKNPLTTPEGMPGVAFQWLEVEGPLVAQWPPAGHRLLFGALPMKANPRKGEGVLADSSDPDTDTKKLLPGFMAAAFRRPVAEAEVAPFLAIAEKARAAGFDFTDSLLAAYTGVLSSPAFLFLEEKPGPLEDRALAHRLAYFLWNSPPDAELLALAAEGKLRAPETLTAQTNRLLDDPKARRFIDAFLDYWLDLRLIAGVAPDAELYPDYQLDDLLVESMTDETRLFFAELLRRDLGAVHLVASDFAMLNERMATHYGLPDVHGIQLRPVALPAESARGGLLTQASVLKVTANGTTTSPVIRGAWIMSRLLGKTPPPPPASVPAVEPDTRGATTIREQLAKHRSEESCNACHRHIDPAGFALESFDVMGAWRARYRSLGAGEKVPGIGHNGLFYHFALGPPVDPSGELPDGRKFQDVRELKACLAADPEQLARNLTRQLAVYATGAPIRFSDRPKIAKILESTRDGGYGVRSLIHALIHSELFLHK